MRHLGSTARRIAEVMRDGWAPFCERVEIAGSIRRQCATVKDVELVAMPKWSEEPAAGQGSLFGGERTEPVNLLQREIERMVAGGGLMVLKPGTQEIVPWELKPRGRYWRLYVPEISLKVDLFLPTRPGWGLTYTLRTGSGVGPDGQPFTGFGPALLRRWKHISPGGFSRESQLHTRTGEVVPTPEERNVFDVLCMKWVPPNERRSASDAEKAFL